jgi:hypothetical protein
LQKNQASRLIAARYDSAITERSQSILPDMNKKNTRAGRGSMYYCRSANDETG